MKIRGAVFDLGEVLLHGLYGTENVIKRIHGVEVAKNIFFDTPEKDNFFRGRITEGQYWQSVINKHNLLLTVPQLKYCVRANFREIDGTRDLIEKLGDRGYILGLLSIHGKEWIDNCEARFCYHHLFHATCYSFENGLCKPEPEAYRAILSKLNLRPQECLFIDDGAVNVQAAANLGMHGIRFIDAADLKIKLKNLNLV